VGGKNLLEILNPRGRKDEMEGSEFNKLKRKLLSVRFLIVLSAISLTILYFNKEVKGADWKFLGKTNEFNHYYDAESITHPSKNITRVQVKMVSINNKGKDLVLRQLRAAKTDKRSTKAYVNYTHSIAFHEIRCFAKMARIISVADYNDKGMVLASHTYRDPEFSSIDPEGIGDLLYKEVCR
jgi:hypothetical protein